MPEKVYGDGLVDKLSARLSPYDDFYIERYTVTDYVDLLERIQEHDDVALWDVDAWKEAVLAEGYGSFCFDW